jgi:anti-anti-sigma factor
MSIEPLIQVRFEYEKYGKINVKIIYLTGKITLSNSMEVANKLKKNFTDANYYVVIDLSQLQYLDSKGMAMLLTLEKTIKENNGELVMTKPNKFVQELFNLTNLNSYFNFVKDIEDARSHFQSLNQ